MSTINALVTRVGVNMGDHGQDVTKAVAPQDGETVQEFAERVLLTKDWRGNVTPPDGETFITIRLVAEDPPAPTVSDAGGEVRTSERR